MTFAEFFDFTNITFILVIFISIINSVLIVLDSRKFLQILQISGYKIKGYNHWLKDTKAKYVSRLTMLTFLSLAAVLVTNFLFDVYNSDALFSYIGLIFYIYFTIVFVVHSNKIPQKTPLVQTRRMSRLTTYLFVFSLVISFGLMMLATVCVPFLRYGIITLTPLIVPILVPFVHFISLPLEKLIRFVYVMRAKKKLEKFPNLIKIGITGSYGKTSVKYILNKMLAEKYNVCITPHSFNTPMGVTKVILKYLKRDNEILIVEMGAKEVGDVKELCDIVKPTHGIITAVGTQHYESFGSVENIAKTKFELIEALPNDAIAVFNVQGDNCQKLYEKCNLTNKFAVNPDGNGEVIAQNVVLGTQKTQFDLSYNGKIVHCKTVLLGKHTISNILLASCMAIKLGVGLEDIAKAIADIEPISHRLETTVNGNVTIIDDSYSANQEGAFSALQILSLYKEEIKICVTPGIVELGNKEKEINMEYGKKLAQICDYVIVVNKVNEDAIKQGIKEENPDFENVISAENLENAKEKIKNILKSDKKFAILFANDLPDNYT